MNYRPNEHARALATSRSNLIGVVVPDLMNLYFAEVVRAIESVARPAGFQLLICSTDEDATREIGEVEALLHRTDGLIISSVLAPTNTGAYRKMIKEGARIVLVDRTMQNLRCPSVATDNVLVGRMATEHLISLGHDRIGHLSGDASSVSSDRLEGYKQSLANHRLRFDQKLVRPCGLLESDGYRAMRDWLTERNLPGAIFAVNDAAAIGAMKALEEDGIEIGRDVALVGAGNIHYGDMLRVPLTTISWSRAETGQQAAQLLIKLMSGEPQDSRARKIILPPELVVRNSCGAKPFGKEPGASVGRLARYSH
jgi:LacI family transcriptional regulator